LGINSQLVVALKPVCAAAGWMCAALDSWKQRPLTQASRLHRRQKKICAALEKPKHAKRSARILFAPSFPLREN
jgi:hypothetical protein